MESVSIEQFLGFIVMLIKAYLWVAIPLCVFVGSAALFVIFRVFRRIRRNNELLS